MFPILSSLTNSIATHQSRARIRYSSQLSCFQLIICQFSKEKTNFSPIVGKVNVTKCHLFLTSQTSAVEISEIVYRNVSGTSKSQKAIKFACSDNVPCSHIVLNNINLETRDGTAEVYCNSATGIGYGYIHPSAECLNSSGKKIEKMEAMLHESKEEYLVHTEL